MNNLQKQVKVGRVRNDTESQIDGKSFGTYGAGALVVGVAALVPKLNDFLENNMNV